MELDIVNDECIPITDAIFIKQGWTKNEETEDGTTFYYWTLPLPKDNPDRTAPVLISTANDEWESIGLQEGQYAVEIFEFHGLGYCECEQDIEDLYAVLTGSEIMDDEPIE